MITFAAVERMKLDPDEALIVWMPEGTSPSIMDAALDGLVRSFPDNRVLVLEHGVAIERRPRQLIERQRGDDFCDA